MPLAIRYRAEAPEGDPLEGLARLATTAPHPIAVPLWLVASEENPAQRFMLLLKNLLDAVLRYAALVATSDYLAGRSPPSDRVNGSLAGIVRKVPSEGKWLELLRECVAACGASSLVPELGAFLRSAELDRRAQVRVSFPEAGLERGWSGKISTWIGLRNALLAHGPSPEDLEQANTEIARLALSVLEAMQPLFSWLLVRRTSPVGPLVLRGPSKERFERYSGTPLQGEVFLAHEREDRRFELHPLLVSGLEGEKALPEVGTENVLLYDHLRSRTVVYRNESMVARMRADKFDALRSALAKRGVELSRPAVEVSTFEELQAASRAQVDRMVQREIDERRYDPTTYLVRERVERHLRTFSEGPAEALFMVGESGCGKSNTLFRYASARAAAGDVVLITRASTLWENGLPSLTELEEALRREMSIKEDPGRWAQLTSEANEGKLPSERRSVLLIIDQLDSFMGQGRTPWGLFRRLEELVRRHEEGRCIKLVTVMRRDSVRHILEETGAEPPLGSVRHYQPGDEKTGPAHPSWFLTVGPLNDDEAGQLLESAMRSCGLEPVQFKELSKGWRRVLRIPYAVRRYVEACEVLGGPPHFRASLRKLEEVLHAARTERRQEILMQLVRYCAEHHVADPSVDEILKAGGPLAEAIDEVGTGSDYEWLRANGLVREDTVDQGDGTMRSRVTFSHDRVLETGLLAYERSTRRFDWRQQAMLAAVLAGIIMFGTLRKSWQVLSLRGQLAFLEKQLLAQNMEAGATRVARERLDSTLMRLWFLGLLATIGAAAILLVIFSALNGLEDVGRRARRLLARRYGGPTREDLERARLKATFESRVPLWLVAKLATAGAFLFISALIADHYFATPYVLPCVLVLGGVVVPIVVSIEIGSPIKCAVVRSDPPALWSLDMRLLWESWREHWASLGFMVAFVVAVALASPLISRGAQHYWGSQTAWAWVPAREGAHAVHRLAQRPELRDGTRKSALELAAAVSSAAPRVGGSEVQDRWFFWSLAAAILLFGLSNTACRILSRRHVARKLQAELAARRANAKQG